MQDEIKLTRWLIVNGGLRYDRYEQFQRVTPRAALIVMPSSSQSFKYLFGSAFRAPNAYELNTFYFGDGVAESAARVDRHARARVGALYQRLAAHVGVDLLVQGRRPDHAGTRPVDASWARPTSTAGTCAPAAWSSRRRCGSVAGAGAGELRAAARTDVETGITLVNSPRRWRSCG